MVSERVLRKDIRNLKQDVLRLVNHLGESDAPSKAGNALVELKSNSLKQLRDYVSDLEDGFERAKAGLAKNATQVKSKIEDRPFAAVVAALGVGFLIGAVLPMLKGDDHVS